MKKTTLRQNVTNQDRTWYVVDATDMSLGRLSVAVANVLRGKNRVDYTPHVDGGDYVVILNADKVAVSGDKELNKKYYSHSGYLGHLKVRFLDEVRKEKPARILQEAVSGMLTKTRHRAAQMKRLKLVMGAENPYQSQKPQPLTIK